MAAASGCKYTDEMEAAFTKVDELFDPEYVLGKLGAQFVYSHAIRSSNHAFNVAVTILAGLAPLTNGASVHIFPGHASPLNIVAVLVGYPQTRKSQMTKLLKTMGEALDEHILGVARSLCEQSQEEGEGNGMQDDPNKLVMTTAVLQSFTPEVLFERCSGDFVHVSNSDDFSNRALQEPLQLGRMANIDEAYAVFNEFGLLQDDKGRRSTSQASAVNIHAGTLNRFLQFGECARATRTAGNYGGGAVPATSFALGADMHPEAAIPMERCEIGNHTGRTKERFVFYAARRVQPHEAIPTAYVMPAGVDRWSWVELDEELAAMKMPAAKKLKSE